MSRHNPRSDEDLSTVSAKADTAVARSRQTTAALLVLSLVWLGPILACGSFQPRPTPTPSPAPTQAVPMESQSAAPIPTDTPVIIIEPTATPTPEPTATFTPTPIPGTVLAVGQPARVVAAGGLNLRDAPSSNGSLVVQLGVGQRLNVVEGPVSADGFTWWRLDDGQGTSGWAAQGDGTDEWLAPISGNGNDVVPVNRAPRVGDRVRVTMDAGQQLSIRNTPGTNATVLTRVNSGLEFTVLAGPQSANGFIWYQIRSDNGEIQGWAADGNDTTRWLSPLE